MFFEVKEVGCPELISRETLKTNWNKVKLMSELIILIIFKKPKSSV